MPTQHLKYGGSVMARTVNCPAWPNKVDFLNKVEAPRNAAADHGSCLHECMETIVLGDAEPADFLDKHFEEWDHTVTQDDVGLMITAMKAFDEVADEYKCEELEVEQFVQLTHNIGGSADVITAGPKHVLVVDWKFGYHPVHALRSWQAATYALSSMNTPHLEAMFEGKRVVAVIIQPKVSPKADVYEFGETELMDMAAVIFEAVKAAESGEAEPVPGTYCQYCPSAPVCPAKLLQGQAALDLPKDVSMPLAVALELAEQLEPWIKEVKNFAHEMLEQGADIEGWKLVDKRPGGRTWIDADQALQRLKALRKVKMEDYCDIKLMTPPALEKVLKAKNVPFDKVSDLVQPGKSSGTTLAREEDKRPAVSALITEGEAQAALAKLG